MKRRNSVTLTRLLFLTAVLLTLLAGCGKHREKEDTESTAEHMTELTESAETKEETASETTESATEAEKDTDASEEITSEETAEETTEHETEPESEPVIPELYSNEGLVKSVYSGKFTDPYVEAVNEKTYGTAEANVFPVLSEESFSTETVREMILSYTLPEKAYYGDSVRTDALCQELLSYRNLEALPTETADDEPAMITPRYGILVRNSDMRGFPTMLRATDNNAPKDFDFFQETELLYASGVLVLHQTADGLWSFVRGENYFGWIRTEDIAYLSWEVYVQYLSPEHFIISNGLDTANKERFGRLGVILPIRVEGDHIVTVCPGRDENGYFYEDVIPYMPSEAYHEGYYPYDESTGRVLTEQITALKDAGMLYGWGDTEQNYDCSSTLGLLYRLFGFQMPRNTSAMKCFGGSVRDISMMTDEEKCAILNGCMGAILIMPGHAMMLTAENTVCHNNSLLYTDPSGTGIQENYRLVESPLNGIFGKDGTSFLTKLTYVISWQ